MSIGSLGCFRRTHPHHLLWRIPLHCLGYCRHLCHLWRYQKNYCHQQHDIYFVANIGHGTCGAGFYYLYGIATARRHRRAPGRQYLLLPLRGVVTSVPLILFSHGSKKRRII